MRLPRWLSTCVRLTLEQTLQTLRFSRFLSILKNDIILVQPPAVPTDKAPAVLSPAIQRFIAEAVDVDVDSVNAARHHKARPNGMQYAITRRLSSKYNALPRRTLYVCEINNGRYQKGAICDTWWWPEPGLVGVDTVRLLRVRCTEPGRVREEGVGRQRNDVEDYEKMSIDP
jgi:hypothetical protein